LGAGCWFKVIRLARDIVVPEQSACFQSFSVSNHFNK
jgi:hypothetical protein